MTFTDRESILILSGKHGLLDLEPYDQRISSVMATVVRGQAAERGILNKAVVALGGRDYYQICLAVWPTCATPMAVLGSMGRMLAWLSDQCEP